MSFIVASRVPLYGMSAVMAWGLLGCGPDCVAGFAADDEGICRAVRSCPIGHERRTDLACHPVVTTESEESSPGSTTMDSGDPPTDTGTAPPLDEDAFTSGQGRIFIRYDNLDNYTMHGFVVMGRHPEFRAPTSSFCQVILDQSVNILGPMRFFDGVSDPCPSQGDALVFEPGPVVLQMSLSSGVADSPALCDERVVTVDGDITVDFGDVTSCQE